MKSYGGVKGKLDKLVGAFFRSRPCDYKQTNPEHECKGRLEWIHIKTRSYLCLRWDFFNNLTLCSGAHFHFHKNPDLFIEWIQKNFPGRIEYLNKKLSEAKPIKKWELEELLKNKHCNAFTQHPFLPHPDFSSSLSVVSAQLTIPPQEQYIASMSLTSSPSPTPPSAST